VDPDAAWGAAWRRSRDACIRWGGYHRRERGSFGVNLGRPTYQWGLCGVVVGNCDISLSVVSGVGCGMNVLEGVYLPQREGAVSGFLVSIILGTWIGIFKLNAKIFKLSYYRNYCMDSIQILHTNKDH